MTIAICKFVIAMIDSKMLCIANIDKFVISTPAVSMHYTVD